MIEKRTSVIANWEIFCMGDWYQLRGNVLNDDRFPDGDYINTSMLQNVDFLKGLAETHNTVYLLQ